MCGGVGGSCVVVGVGDGCGIGDVNGCCRLCWDLLFCGVLLFYFV